MADTLVREQGATRWTRPGDFAAPLERIRRNPNPPPGTYRPPRKAPYEPAPFKQPGGGKKPKPGQPGYVPRNPRAKPMVPGFGRGLPRNAKELPRIFAQPFGRAGGKNLPLLFGRALPIGRYLSMLDLVEEVVYPQGKRKPQARGSWTVKHDCNVGGPWNRQGSYRAAHAAVNCLTGQAGTTYPIGSPVLDPVVEYVIGSWNKLEGAQSRIDNKLWFWRPGVGTGTERLVQPAVDVTTLLAPASPRLNPNLMRVLPSLRAQPEAQPDPGGAGEPDLPVRRGIAFNFPGGGRPPRRNPTVPIKRRPPKRREKERKNLARAIVGNIMRVLDEISELAEVVDAFYDALPASTRKRWDRKSRGLIDQAGQYGIDGADWKLQALWHNWHRVDTEKALVNIINNQAQDALLGMLHRNLPRNKGGAFDDAFLGIDDALKEHLFLESLS